MTERSSNDCRQLLSYLKQATSPFHTVAESARLLTEAGFTCLDAASDWALAAGGAYYVCPYPASLFAFTIGAEYGMTTELPLRIAAAHTDFPCLHVKPKAEATKCAYRKLLTEVYGGPILSTWMDRPLSIAGRVALRPKQGITPVTTRYDAGRPLLTVPNLAIHLNPEANKGAELKKSVDLLPLFSMKDDADTDGSWFLSFLAKELSVPATEILDYDLYVYNAEQGLLLGANEDFLSAPRLDNLTSCHALLQALCAKRTTLAQSRDISVIALFDNEEVGSRTKQGADSSLLPLLLKKLYRALSLSEQTLHDALLHGFLISADVAHALHPNRAEQYDSENYGCLNEGVLFKLNSNQRYATDTQAIATAMLLCEQAAVPYRKFVNHADVAGGSTLGPILSAWLPMKTIDVGIPLLAMHSARELAGVRDTAYLERFLAAYFCYAS